MKIDPANWGKRVVTKTILTTPIRIEKEREMLCVVVKSTQGAQNTLSELQQMRADLEIIDRESYSGHPPDHCYWLIKQTSTRDAIADAFREGDRQIVIDENSPRRSASRIRNLAELEEFIAIRGQQELVLTHS